MFDPEPVGVLPPPADAEADPAARIDPIRDGAGRAVGLGSAWSRPPAGRPSDDVEGAGLPVKRASRRASASVASNA